MSEQPNSYSTPTRSWLYSFKLSAIFYSVGCNGLATGSPGAWLASSVERDRQSTSASPPRAHSSQAALALWASPTHLQWREGSEIIQTVPQ